MKIITTLSKKVPEGASKYVVQYLAAFAAFLSILNSGMHYGWPSPSLPLLLSGNHTIHITSSEGSWMATINLMGSVLGALITAAIAHHVGRKSIITLSSPPFLLSWAMIAFGDDITLLYIARFIAGVADGFVYTVVPMYVGEISSPAIRGAIGSGIATSWILGILIINLIGSYTDIRTTALICSILPVLSFFSMMLMPESPYYLLLKGYYEKAKESLQVFRGSVDVDAELNRINGAIMVQSRDSGHFLELFTKKSNRKAVAVMVILRTMQQITGTAAIAFYSQHIFEETGNNVSSKVASITYFSLQLLFTLISSSIVDKTGRRPLLMISITGTVAALLLEGTYFYLKDCTTIDTKPFSFVAVGALVGFVIFFSLGLQSIPVLMLGELFPANVKALALGIADIYYSILATVASKFFQITKDAYGMYVPFYSFGVSCVFGLVITALFTPETKGKTLEEIQEYFEGKHREKKSEANPGDPREL